MIKQDKKNKSNEHRLYEKLAKFVLEWTEEENKLGRKPFQSEIVGALEMVKADLYARYSADRIITKRFSDILKVLDGKSVKVDNKNHSITVMQNDTPQKPKN